MTIELPIKSFLNCFNLGWVKKNIIMYVYKYKKCENYEI